MLSYNGINLSDIGQAERAIYPNISEFADSCEFRFHDILKMLFYFIHIHVKPISRLVNIWSFIPAPLIWRYHFWAKYVLSYNEINFSDIGQFCISLSRYFTDTILLLSHSS